MGGRRLWGYRATYLLLTSLIAFAALLPFGPDDGVPGPELTFCLTCAWVLRRPDYVPIWLLIPVLLLQDALMMRPLGLWTLITFLVTEYLRRRVDHSEALPFWSEVALVSAWIVAAFGLYHVSHLLLLAETAPVRGLALQALATIVFYPLIAIFSQLIGVRRLAPGELDTLGSRA